MRQVLINKQGKLTVADIPAPTVEPGKVLVRTEYSVISPGTEVATIKHHSAGLVSKAISKPELIGKVADQVMKKGAKETVEFLKDNLTRWTALGYSASGTILEVGEGVSKLKAGDKVACIGAEYAYHADIICVPENLAVHVPQEVSFKNAAFAPIAAIAMQATRKCEISIGETAAVIGLGLVGLLACRILSLSGCHVIGIDPSENRRKLAMKMGAIDSVAGNEASKSTVESHTTGLGVDVSVITAASETSEPLILGAELCREGGKLVVVGDVKLDIDRNIMYRKELDLIMSRSTGPGRYDFDYENKGQDYPSQYVRWTEAGNVDSCLKLMANESLNVDPIITTQITVDNIDEAYELLSTQDSTVAVLINYSQSSKKPNLSTKLDIKPLKPLDSSVIGAAVIGTGEFSKAITLPVIRASNDFNLIGVANRTGHTAEHAARVFGASYATTDSKTLFKDESVQAIWINTAHDSHASLAIEAINSGKHVFLEKPIALNLKDARKVLDASLESDTQLMLGFNRRFAPASLYASTVSKESQSAKHIIYRVRGDSIPENHWLNDDEIGGGRLLGEAVHFLDWMTWIIDKEPISVQATQSGSDLNSFSVTLSYADGSLGTLVYSMMGSPDMQKESIDILMGNTTLVIDNFEKVKVCKKGKRDKYLKLSGKGHKEQLVAFQKSINTGTRAHPNASDGVRATACAIAALKSIRNGCSEILDPSLWAIKESS